MNDHNVEVRRSREIFDSDHNTVAHVVILIINTYKKATIIERNSITSPVATLISMKTQVAVCILNVVV